MEDQRMETAGILIDVSSTVTDSELDKAIALLYKCKIEKAFQAFENTAHVKPLPKKLKAALSC